MKHNIFNLRKGERLAPLSPVREGRPIGVYCDSCGIDRAAVEMAGAALGITAPICCEVVLEHCAHGERLGAFCISCESGRVG